MLKYYFFITWRNLTKRKLHTTINIIGLGTGMAACIVILLFVFYERSFDRMHHKNIYRLNELQKFSGKSSAQKVATTMFPMGPTLKNEFREVLNYSRVQLNSQYELTYSEKRLFLPQTYFVDTSFLQMFDFPLLQGDRPTALQKPNSIVLTESVARELFGNADPIGKTITHFGDDTLLFTVTGILKDIPGNSQFQFGALQSYNTIYKPDWMNRWDANWLNTYVELAPNADVDLLEKKFPAYLNKHLSSDQSKNYELFLLALRDVHANAVDISEDDINFQKFDKRYTKIFVALALLILLIACINFVNLSTARTAEREKEVGVRKSIGALRSQLAFQFLSEAVLLSLLALVLAIGLLILVVPYISKLSGRNLSSIFFIHPMLIAAVFVGTIVVGFLSGLYPAIYLSSFQPAKVLKGRGDRGKNKGNFRNILVVGQFASAIFLIVATVVIFGQLNYMRTQDPGFERDQIITVRLNGITARKYALLKEELSANPLVVGVTGAWDQLGSHWGPLGFGFWPGNAPMRVLFTPGIFVDPDYLSVYKIRLAAGRNFGRDKYALASEYIINETMAKELLKDQPSAPLSSLIGLHFGGDSTGTIVGIAKDFNFNSLHYKIEPLFLYNDPNTGFSTMSVKINGRQSGEAIKYIQSTWKKVFPEYSLSYQFLDDHFREVYRTDA
jgi:putative ABC transport system permease protein